MKTIPNFAKAKLVKELYRQPFAFPGCYEKFAITNDGAILCRECIRSKFKLILHSTLFNYRDGWQVIALDLECNSDNDLLVCDHCNRNIRD